MVSIIIPIYNAGEKLNRMLASIAKQTYQEYEILLINDGSTDQTEQICKEAAVSDERIIYFYQKNSGVSVARNLGMEKARGQYITFLDADDEIDENYLDILLRACEKADIAVCDVVCEEESGKELNRFTLTERILTQQEALNYLLSRTGINSGPCAKLFKKEVIEQLKFPLLKAYEDILFVKEAFYRAQRIAVVDSTAYHYIQNGESTMQSFFKSPKLDIVVATDRLADDIVKDSRLNETCLYITLSHLYQYVIPLLKEQNGSFIKEAQRVFRKYYIDILKNHAFPWKEKIVYGLFVLGWSYQDGKIRKVK